MRTLTAAGLIRGTTIIALVALVTSCSLLKKKTVDDGGTDAAPATADSTSDAAPAAPAASATPTASNEDDIARFPDETKLDSVAATVQRFGTVREAPLTGKPVSTVNKGAAVSEVAQHGQYFLVVFDNPKDASKKLMGWLHQDAFSPITADAGIKVPVCTAPEVPLLSDSAFCGRTCNADPDCPSGQACKGLAQPFTGGKVGAAVPVCTVYQRPDAGVSPVPVVPTAIVDAGAPKAGDVFSPPCFIGFKLVAKDHMCHRTCASSVGACAKGNFCITCDNQRVCSTARDMCK